MQHGSCYSSDWGSTNKRKAYSLARDMCKEYPDEEIRIVYCTTESDFCEKEVVIREGIQ